MSYKKIKPLGDRILVKRSESESSRGGILLPDSAQEKPKQGEVLAMGPGKMDEKGGVTPIDLKVGDQVLFGAFAGTEVEVSDELEYLIMSEEDILAVVN
ncbi:MAG: 10 kDa chaperonin [Chlamydiae bacterium]|nr:10 kDa chaperonin [Chlamydiota bacterium]